MAVNEYGEIGYSVKVPKFEAITIQPEKVFTGANFIVKAKMSETTETLYTESVRAGTGVCMND